MHFYKRGLKYLTLRCLRRRLDSLCSGALFGQTPLYPSDILMGCFRFAGSLATHGHIGSSRKAVFCVGKERILPAGCTAVRICHGTSSRRTPVTDKQSIAVGWRMNQGVSQAGGVCCIYFFFWLLLPVTESKEGTWGPCLPGRLNAEACRMQVLVYTYFQQAWHAVIACLSALSSASDQSLPYKALGRCCLGFF